MADGPVASQSPIALVVDASCDVPVAERIGAWTLISETWRAAGPQPQIALDDTGDPSRELVELTLGSSPPRSEPPDVERYAQAYAALTQVPRVYSIHPGPAFSPAIAAARSAAADFPHVRVIETTAGGIATGLLAVRLQQLAAESHPLEALDAWIQRALPTLRLVIVPDRLAPPGGQRLSTALLLAGRPLVAAEGGAVTRGARLRSRKATVTAVRRYIERHAPPGRVLAALGHADAPGAVDPLYDLLERTRPDATVELVGRVGPRLLSRVGARCVALAWLAE